MNVFTRNYLEGAMRLGLAYELDASGKTLTIFKDGRTLSYRACVSSLNDAVAARNADDKVTTSKVFHEGGLPVPEFIYFNYNQLSENQSAIDRFIKDHEAIVVKPSIGYGGVGITVMPQTKDEAMKAIELAAQSYPEIIIEKYIPGKHFRIFMVGSKLMAAAERVRGHVVGDGIQTVSELIDELCQSLYNKPAEEYFHLQDIEVFIQQNNLSFDAVPAEGEKVLLHEKVSLKYGSSFQDVTDIIHPSIVRICQKGMELMNLKHAGFDFITEDISADISNVQGYINEVNSKPSNRICQLASDKDVIAMTIKESFKLIEL